MKIYVDFKKPRTVRAFLARLFSYTYEYHSILYPITSVRTYKDEACTKVQCPAGRRRSIQDVFACVRTYFPDATDGKILAALVSLHPSGKNFSPTHCSDIQRPVVCYQTGKTFNLPAERRSKYNWGKLFRELGITNSKELYEYKG